MAKKIKLIVDGKTYPWTKMILACARDVGLKADAGALNIAMAVCEKMSIPYTNRKEIIRDHAERVLREHGSEIVRVSGKKRIHRNGYRRPTCLPKLGDPHPSYKRDDSFYTSREWKEVRYFALVKAGGACQCCGAKASDGVVLHV